jgi:hypothetical protein
MPLPGQSCSSANELSDLAVVLRIVWVSSSPWSTDVLDLAEKLISDYANGS